MAHLGGGAEAHARFKQYRANSSLMLTADSQPRDTHEPESLYGKIDPKTFGDRAYRGRPAELDEKLKELDLLTDQPIRQEDESVLKGVYQFKTTAYEEMLSVIDQELGGQPPCIVSGAVEDILAVLKNESLKKIGEEKRD